MNPLAERIRMVIPGLVQFQGELPKNLIIQDVLRPISDFLPWADEKSFKREISSGRGDDDEDRYSAIMERSENKKDLPPGLHRALFSPVIKTSRKPIAHVSIEEFCPPSRISAGIWLGIRALIGYYSDNGIPVDGLLGLPLDNNCFHATLMPFLKLCESRSITMHRPEHLPMWLSIKDTSIILEFPYYCGENDGTVFEIALQGAEGLFSLMDWWENELFEESHNFLTKDEVGYIRNMTEFDLFDVYAESKLEKIYDPSVCAFETHFDKVYKEHGVIGEIGPALVTYEGEMPTFSLIEKNDIDAYFAYCEAFAKAEDSVPDWLWNGGVADFALVIRDAIKIHKIEKGNQPQKLKEAA